MSRTPAGPHGPRSSGAGAPAKPAALPPAKAMYLALRQRHGLTHEAATRCLREALKGYFRAS